MNWNPGDSGIAIFWASKSKECPAARLISFASQLIYVFLIGSRHQKPLIGHT